MQERDRDDRRRAGPRLLPHRVRDPRPTDQMNEIAAYGGFPEPLSALALRHGVRAPAPRATSTASRRSTRWSSTTTPSYAYLLEGNTFVDQKLVMAHVYGHVDFFKNNYCFSRPTLDRRMIDGMANNGLAACARLHGSATGASQQSRPSSTPCLSLENLIDPWLPFRRMESGPRGEPAARRSGGGDARRPRARPPAQRPQLHGGLHQPAPSFLEPQQPRRSRPTRPRSARTRPHPERDVLGFLHRSTRRSRRWERRRASASSARRPTTSCRRCRRRS